MFLFRNISVFVSAGWAVCSEIEVFLVLSRKIEGERESLRRVRALMAPLTTSSVMVSLSLSECCEIADWLSTAEDSEETNGLLIQSAER